MHISKEELEQKYINENLSRSECALYFRCNETKIANLVQKFKIKKDKSKIVENRKKTWLKKYGTDNPAKVQKIKEKMKQTCLEKYGVEWPGQNALFKEKMKQTCLEKYGVEFNLQSQEFKTNSKKTCLEKYGVEHQRKAKIIQEKSKKTNLEKYGHENPAQGSIKEKIKKTNLKRYGVDNWFKSNEYKEMWNNKEWVNSIIKKGYETKKKNGTYLKSKIENEIYALLIERFNNVERQFSSDLYPFVCDFYIPELDLYIEYQGHQTHGGKPFENNEQDKLKVQHWFNKSKELNHKGKFKHMYLSMIKTWTIRDVEKRNIAKQNNLNWLEFFNKKEFISWISKKEALECLL